MEFYRDLIYIVYNHVFVPNCDQKLISDNKHKNLNVMPCNSGRKTAFTHYVSQTVKWNTNLVYYNFDNNNGKCLNTLMKHHANIKTSRQNKTFVRSATQVNRNYEIEICNYLL